MGRPPRPNPASFVVDWPIDAAPVADAEVARRFALNLREALGGRSLREARDATGVDHTAIADILNGNTWPDLRTIARLEEGLGADLWPGRGNAG